VRAAEYPEKKCREGVFSAAGLGYPCELPNMHLGPCASFSAANTVEARERWEAANPDKVGKSDLDGGDIIVDSNGRTTA
jgi:hypothetical protein